MKIKAILVALALSWIYQCAFAFNLWQDIQTQTRWTLGNTVAAGTAWDINDKQFVATALAGISEYRMLSLWYGGSQIPGGDGKLTLTDTAKFGLNVGYFLQGFVNQPPALLKNLVIGPAVAVPVFTTPRRVSFLIDINYAFSGSK